MKILAGFFFAAVLIVLAAATVSIFGLTWTVPAAPDWKIDDEGGFPTLHLLTGREPLPGPRRPFQFAIAGTPEFYRVTIEADVRPLKRSLMIVFVYRDPAHFDYAHLSTDTGTKQTFHNGVFHVYGGERVRISNEAGPPAFGSSNRWYHVQLVHDGSSGAVHVAVDDKPVPALNAVDLSLTAGRVGLGSFDETADFRNVKISGTSVSPEKK